MITPTVSEIQNAVCEQFNVPLIAMLSQRRGPEWAHPRQIAMALSCEMTTLTLPNVGRLFGDRDHSTVIHAVRVVKKRCDADPLLRARVDAVRMSADARAELRFKEQRETAEKQVKRQAILASDEPKRNVRADRVERQAKVDGCRRLLEAHLRTGCHWLQDRDEVRRLLAA